MVDLVLPGDLPAAGSVPADASFVMDNGSGVFKVTPAQIVAAAPPPSLVYSTLGAFKAAPIANKSQSLQDPSIAFGQFNWETANAPYTADNTNVIKADSTALSVGAWVRQKADASTFLQSGTGAQTRSVEAKLRDIVSAADFGIVGDGVADETAKLQAMFDHCEATNSTPVMGQHIVVRTTSAVTYDPSGLINNQRTPDIDLSNLTIQTSAKTGFILGSASNAIDGAIIRMPSVRGPNDWTGSFTSNEAGCVLYNCRNCTITLGDVRYFSIGNEFRSEGQGFAYNTILAGLVRDCRFSEVLLNVGGSSYCNENKFFGGSISYGSLSSAKSVDKAVGTMFAATSGGDNNHNNNHWFGRSYEMTDESFAGITESVPIWFEGCGVSNHWHGPRGEVWRGPYMHVAGNATSTTNATVGMYNEVVSPGLLGTVGGMQAKFTVRQIAGAYGSTIRAPGILDKVPWRSGTLRDTLYSGGTANGVRVTAPFFLRESTDGTSRRELTLSNRAATNIYGAQWNNGGHFVIIDTTKVKTIECWSSDKSGFEGLWFFQPLDANGGVLCGPSGTTGATGERYVKFPGATPTTLYGGGLTTGTDNATNMPRVTVRDEVKMLVVAKVSGTNALVCNEFGFNAYPELGTLNGTLTLSGAMLIDPLYDAGAPRASGANPGTSGTHGFYGRGGVVGNNAAASGQPSGYVGTNTGALGVAYANSTALAVPGQVIIAGSNAYAVKTAGTTSGSGSGPVGTTPGTNYTDGSVVFNYIGPKATFTALANVP